MNFARWHEEHAHEPVTAHARRDVPMLLGGTSLGVALEDIRRMGIGERIVYFYVVDEAGRLTGVLPTRRLLTESPQRRVEEVMVRSVLSLPEGATLVEALEFFHRHRFLAIPIVDGGGRLTGVLDLAAVAGDFLDSQERLEAGAAFEAVGIRLGQWQKAGTLPVLGLRGRWLLVTVASGLMCAALAGAFAAILDATPALAFFIALVLGLGESASMQTMTLTIQALHVTEPTWSWFRMALVRELKVSAPLGLALGGLVAAVAGLWTGFGPTPAALGAAVALAVNTSCVLGLSIPAVLHALRLDYKIAASPLTLALADLATLSLYFGVAALMVG